MERCERTPVRESGRREFRLGDLGLACRAKGSTAVGSGRRRFCSGCLMLESVCTYHVRMWLSRRREVCVCLSACVASTTTPMGQKPGHGWNPAGWEIKENKRVEGKGEEVGRSRRVLARPSKKVSIL